MASKPVKITDGYLIFTDYELSTKDGSTRLLVGKDNPEGSTVDLWLIDSSGSRPFEHIGNHPGSTSVLGFNDDVFVIEELSSNEGSSITLHLIP